MTAPLTPLERFLRDGPPDEAGYRPRSLDVSPLTASNGATGVIRVDRVGTVRTRDRTQLGSSWQFLAAVLVVAVGAGLVGVVSLRDRSGATEPASSAVPAIANPPLTAPFVSPRNGFSIRYPAGWTVTQATAAWPPDVFLPYGHPALDQFVSPGVGRLVVASQRLGAGQTAEDFIAAYVEPYAGPKPCVGPPSTWPRLPIDGESGYLIAADCPVSLDKRIADRDVSFQTLVFAGGRVYQIRFDGDVDLASFEALLATVRLTPSLAID